MTTIRVTGNDGAAFALEMEDGAPIMEALRDRNLVLGTCGGMMSCGTCHVYVLAGDAAIAPAGEDERDMLEALADVVEITPNSRLSCQIVATPAASELWIEIGPQF